ncbi:hypothetical protein KO495_08010 [Colwellia sp. D2M02]|uniref:hypothetical protein n=1 Tax=Colwellia sp. D2M02 TaxID=2841562 RepID=UPI001C08846A|nr:hypothetical protein [Colwellia sp. D2M02]MBU2893271.1 hypothetical protein [Colwellia sp. D2M02]
MNATKLFISVLIFLSSATVLAHSGHDHNAANSTLIHLLWLAPVIVVMAAMSYRKIKATKSDKNH